MTISGDDEQIAAARRLVLAIVRPPTKVIECPPGFRVAALIGPKGSQIKSMQEESGAKISIDSESDPAKVTISGDDEQIAAARRLVQAIIHPPNAQLTCDADHARLLIGPGGATLKEIEAESGARVRVDTASGGPPTITIEAASRAAVEHAARLVRAITEPAATTIRCSATALSHVLGPGGATIKALMARTGAIILASDGADGAAATVRVEGAPAAIARAEAEVRRIIDEEAHPDYAGPEGDRLRADAEAHARARSRLMAEADACFNAEPPDRERGHALAAEAKAEGERMREANRAAAAAILRHRNGGRGERYLDLHGLLVEEAVRATTERLDALALAGGGGELELVPGAGHHSAGGKAAIKPAVEALLQERALEYEEHVGTLKVHLARAGK